MLALPLLANKCKEKAAADGTTNLKSDSETWVMQVEGKVWINLYEADKDGNKAYRDSKYDFPPSRGRSGFQIDADGTFYETKPGPTDLPTKVKGAWEWVEANKSIKATLGENSYKLTFISLEDGLLMLKKESL